MRTYHLYNNIITMTIIAIFLFCGSEKNKAQDTVPVGLIPLPAGLNETKSTFTLNENSRIINLNGADSINSVGLYLKDQISFLTGLSLGVDANKSKAANSIILSFDTEITNSEGYFLEVTDENITIKGAGVSGLFYGVQTLLQLIYPQVQSGSEITIPGLVINDAPQFKWRGMHMDVSRHFYSVSFIKKMLDIMASLKLNTFHWHLTDDQGWRIEIKRYPKLTEVGAWRKETMEGHYTETDQKFDGMRYGGYYTQEEIKEVVKYAQSRQITIVPEIEMPGHAVAALSAYPEYSCTGGPFDVYTKWGVSDDVYCAGKDETFVFLENILDEVIELFPGQYIHVGGDECPKSRWEQCPHCQKRIADEGLKNEFELQSYFIKRIEKYIASKGKKLIGWDEILEGGLAERATVMSWRGFIGGVEAAHTGHYVVMAPTDFCYFDYYQGNPAEEPLAIGGALPLDKVYAFNPVPSTLSIEDRKYILGAQANVWTEYITNENKFEYMVFPRLCAMAEILWTPVEKQNYRQFLTRLDSEFLRLEKYRVNYRPKSK